MNLWDHILNGASFMLLALVGAVIVYGIAVPAINKAPFGQDSLNRHPKIQYTGFVVLSIALDANTYFGGWVTQMGEWLRTGGEVIAGLTAGQSLTGITAAVLFLLWITVMLPNKYEPTSLGVPGHFTMWGASLLVYPLSAASLGTASVVALAVVIGIGIVAKKRSARAAV